MHVEHDSIAAVLVANEWMDVASGTFEVRKPAWFAGEQSENDRGSFLFENQDGEWLTGPLDSIQAARASPNWSGGRPTHRQPQQQVAPTTSDRFISTMELIQHLAVTRSWFYRNIHGSLMQSPSVRVLRLGRGRRWHVGDVVAFLEQQDPKPAKG